MRVPRRLLLAAGAMALAACAARGPRHELVLTPEADPEVQEALARPASTPPVKTHDVKPERPGGLLTGGARLSVVLDAVITREGKVKVYGVRRSDDAEFAWECVRAVSRWRYQPPTGTDGAPVPLRTTAVCSVTTQ